jgi:bifunctional DNA-binding transcriptional regulator/antitoxin component of YhaV-PrlF toxin-antitoxin module
MKTDKGEVVQVQWGRRITIPKDFAAAKGGIDEGDYVLIESVEKVDIAIKKKG